jgi:hypothetical protein
MQTNVDGLGKMGEISPENYEHFGYKRWPIFVGTIISLSLFCIGIQSIVVENDVYGIAFVLFSIFMLILSAVAGVCIRVDGAGIHTSLFGINLTGMSWNDIAIINIKVLFSFEFKPRTLLLFQINKRGRRGISKKVRFSEQICNLDRLIGIIDAHTRRLGIDILFDDELIVYNNGLIDAVKRIRQQKFKQ